MPRNSILTHTEKSGTIASNYNSKIKGGFSVRSILFKKILPLILCLALLTTMCCLPVANAAKKTKKAQTAEELGYLPAGQLLEDDGQTVKFNDPAVEKALKDQYARLMDENGRFSKKSLSQVEYLRISGDFPEKPENEDDPAYWEAWSRVWDSIRNDYAFTPKLAEVDLSALQFCTKLNSLEVYAIDIRAIPALQSCKSLSWLELAGAKLDLEEILSLGRLWGLVLLGCDVKDYEPLTRHKRLGYLSIKSDTLQDLAFAAKIPRLDNLDIHLAPKADIQPLLEKKSFGGVTLSMAGRSKDDDAWQLLAKCKWGFSLYDVAEWNEEALDTALPKISWLSIYHTEQPADPTDFSFIQKAKKLSSLYINNANIASLAFLAETPKVDWLGIFGSHIVDATNIFLPRLKWGMHLSNNTVENWGSFEGIKAKKLGDVSLSQTNLTDLSFVEGLTITTLWLSGNELTDIAPLAKAKQIQKLSLTGNSIADFSALAGIKGLKNVDLTGAGRIDLSFVEGLSLTSLWLNNNDITDIAPLAAAKKIEKLSLADNPIADFSPLAEIKGLKLVQHNSALPLPELNKCEIVEGNKLRWEY